VRQGRPLDWTYRLVVGYWQSAPWVAWDEGPLDERRSRQLAASAAAYSSLGAPSRRVKRPLACQITSVGIQAPGEDVRGGGHNRGHGLLRYGVRSNEAIGQGG
jgi:hypothetical protein